jgi:hypothetical protein
LCLNGRAQNNVPAANYSNGDGCWPNNNNRTSTWTFVCAQNPFNGISISQPTPSSCHCARRAALPAASAVA